MVTDTRSCPPSGVNGARLGASPGLGGGARLGYIPPAPAQGPTLGNLFRNLVDDTVGLFRHELRLAKTEVSEKAAKAARNAAAVAVGGAVAFAGVLALIAAACTGLWVILVKLDVSNAVAVWLAPLVIGGIVAVVGYAMIHKGLAALRGTRMVPDKTAESLKETGRWIHAKVT